MSWTITTQNPKFKFFWNKEKFRSWIYWTFLTTITFYNISISLDLSLQNLTAATICSAVLLFCGRKEKGKMQNEILNRKKTIIWTTDTNSEMTGNRVSRWNKIIQNIMLQLVQHSILNQIVQHITVSTF